MNASISNGQCNKFKSIPKFLNALPSEWSKFVTDVKLAKSLYTTNYDQLYAYLSLHERQANEVCIMREKYPDPFALVANSPTLYNPFQSPKHSFTQPSQAEFPQLDSSLTVPMFQQGEDPIECINKAMAFLSVIASRFPPSNNQLRTSSDPRNQATIQDAEAQEAGQILDEDQLAFLAEPRISEAPVAQQTIPQNSVFQTEDLDTYDSDCDDLSSAKSVLMTNILSCDPEVLSEVPYSDSYPNDMIIMMGKRCKSQDAVIQDTNSSASNDLLVLSLVEQMTDHVAHLDKENQTNKMLKHSSLSKTLVTSYTPVRIEAPSELPKVSLVNESLKKIKYQLANFDKVVKKRTMSDAITAGAWGFELTKAFVVTKIILFFKVLKETFNAFDKTLLDEIIKVQTIFNQMEAVVDQCSVDKNTFEIQIKQLSIDNDQLLKQIMSQEFMHIVVNYVDSLDVKKSCVNECNKCLELETRLLKKKDLIEKDVYDKLLKSYSTLEKHCISLELTTQLNQKVFQKDNFRENQNAPTFNQLFELNELKAQSQEKDTVIRNLKDRIKSLSKKDIRKTRVQSKEHSDCLIAQINAKSVENSDLNAQLQEKVFSITALKNELRRLKGKNVVDTMVSKPNATIAPGTFKLDIEPISHRLKNNKDAHETCPNSPKPSEKLLVVTPMNKDKSVRLAKPVISLNNIPKQTDSLKTKDSNKPLLTSTGVKPTTSASGSKPLGNTKNNRISRPPSSNQKNKVEDHSRKVKSSLNKMNCVFVPVNNALVKHFVRNAKFEYIYAISNKCLFDANHDMCIIDYVNDVNMRLKSKSKRNKMRKVWKPTGKVFNEIGYSWKPTGRTFTIVGDSRRPKATRFIGSSSKVVQIVLWYLDSGSSKHMTGNCSQLINLVSKFLGTVRFGNDHIAKIMGYEDYQMGIVQGLPKLKYQKDHLCSACALSKNKKHSHKDNTKDSIQEKLYLLHMDLCGPMRVQSINGRKYKLVIVDDISRTDNRTEFVNQTLGYYYEEVGISHQTSVARTPQQNGIVERRNHTLVEAARTISGPGPKLLTPGTISSGLMPNIPSSTPYVPPTKNDWEILFQPMFDEYLNPLPCVDPQVPAVISSEPAASTGTPSSTTIDQDAPSTKPNSEESSTQVVIPNHVHFINKPSEHIKKWTKDHPVDNVIGDPSRPVSTRQQLQDEAIFCYFDAFLSFVEPNSYKDALTESC
ncbi:retrovirus-related pol polyprotein from transposon TNT 1-94 [Tanacetum coccineum]